MNITQIDVLIHPDFYQMKNPSMPLHQIQKDLRSLWDERVNELRNSGDGVLIYFSNMPKDELAMGMRNKNSLDNDIKRGDIDRIKRYQRELGDRFILFSELEQPSAEQLKDIFSSRGFSYEPDETKLCPYGEAFDACVTAWGYHIKTVLQIPNSNYDFYTEGMSLTFEDTKVIDSWRRGVEGDHKQVRRK
ncbi:MAG: hypothetical protein WC851_00355 [Candidatus Shapirobacteria bacterium]|jgi:hypothetical protein